MAKAPLDLALATDKGMVSRRQKKNLVRGMHAVNVAKRIEAAGICVDDPEDSRVAQRPVAKGFQRLTYSEIEYQYGALDALSARALPNEASEDKVFTLLRRHYEDAHQIFMKRRNKAIEAHPVPKGHDDAEMPAAVRQARELAIQRLLDSTHDIPEVPASLILKPADMPRRDIKGEAGQLNKMSLAQIKHRLGFLYPLADERPAATEDNEEE
jgi:hypothetical protein